MRKEGEERRVEEEHGEENEEKEECPPVDINDSSFKNPAPLRF